MEIIGIEAKNGVLISENLKNSSYYNSSIKDKFFDEEQPKSTYHKDWFLIKKKPEKVTRLISGKDINHRFELKDKSFLSDKVKDSFLRDDVASRDSDYDWVYNDEFKDIYSLYELKWDKEEAHYEEIEFEYTTLMTIDTIPELKSFSYAAQLGQWRSDGMGFVTDKHISYQILDKVIFPAPLLQTRPCSLSSKMSYDLVREFVKTNIDSEYAEITSDYNFCFTVKKKIHLTENESYQVDINSSLFSKRKRKPKIITKYRSSRSVEIFEMTHSPKSYSGYTPITGFKGKDHNELIKNIEDYLQKLITEINKPLHDCPHCLGLGVKEFSKIKTNK